MSTNSKDFPASRREVTHMSRTEKVHTAERILSATLFFTPIALLSLLVLVFAYSLQTNSILSKNANRQTQKPHTRVQDSFHLDTAPSLLQLLEQVTDGLEQSQVTYWLLPGLGLLPVSNSNSDKTIDGKLSPWHEGVDIGVFESDVLNVVNAQADLQLDGIVAIESYYGLRLFPINGHADDRYDFRTPFIDIVYFNRHGENITSTCCDCGPITVSACTKKTCGCLPCSNHENEIFPLAPIHIYGMNKILKGPRKKETLMLPRDLDGVHPVIFNLSDSI